MHLEALSFGTAILAYLVGTVPFGLLLTRAAGAGDIRKIGSGNIGATNVLRTGRRGLAAATLLLDAAKGALAVGVAGFAVGAVWMPLAAICVVIGHCFPVWLRFRGGKGVATGLGAAAGAGLADGRRVLRAVAGGVRLHADQLGRRTGRLRCGTAAGRCPDAAVLVRGAAGDRRTGLVAPRS